MTVDLDLRRSPLHDRAAELADVLEEEPFLPQLDVRTRAGVAMGLQLPPTNHVTGDEHRAALGLGPDEYLLIGVTGTEPGHRSVVDVSAARTTLRLHDRALLETLCPLDLDALTAGRCAQTLLARVPVVLWGLGADHRVLVRGSFAGHVASALLDARQVTSTVAQ
ncbi:sarcosine oxidase subunit gamma [Saccharopolyspora rhizosphaerae]|uniref:Sarcosine oxidase subunit gamma n=1 Tax=Saccharopolyspora rhizosphaerae TaxID=2492662 RepID=A0A426JYV4_9PSEU|nr:sarcosine oxidase subunit gamma [Saccharopolyspora rhizosphaerae]RRO18334.1 sarcosine oxidase subunit gamma [Saccharopolyspora rhizosphaerae]